MKTTTTIAVVIIVARASLGEVTARTTLTDADTTKTNRTTAGELRGLTRGAGGAAGTATTTTTTIAAVGPAVEDGAVADATTTTEARRLGAGPGRGLTLAATPKAAPAGKDMETTVTEMTVTKIGAGAAEIAQMTTTITRGPPAGMRARIPKKAVAAAATQAFTTHPSRARCRSWSGTAAVANSRTETHTRP